MLDFQDLKNQIESSFLSSLPGDIEQLRMAPYNRTARDIAKVVNPNPRLSAVLLLIYQKGGVPHFVLMQRPPHPGAHGSQISLPGGKKEEYDDSFQATALRETSEELGIASSGIDIVGELTSVYIPPSGFLVYPYVGFMQNEPNFVPDAREVQYLIESPVARLLDTDVIKDKRIPIGLSKMKIRTPYFDIDNHVVWGATAMILSEFKAMLDADI